MAWLTWMTGWYVHGRGLDTIKKRQIDLMRWKKPHEAISKSIQHPTSRSNRRHSSGSGGAGEKSPIWGLSWSTLAISIGNNMQNQGLTLYFWLT